jgi:hypothetical protein
VLRQLQQWLDRPDPSGWIVVTGGPGMGKSAILSRLCREIDLAARFGPHRRDVLAQRADRPGEATLADQVASSLE